MPEHEHIKENAVISMFRGPKITCLKIKNTTVKVIFFSLKEVGKPFVFERSLTFPDLHIDKIIGTTALTKYYCQYRKDICMLRMINFTQTSTKQVKSKRPTDIARRVVDCQRCEIQCNGDLLESVRKVKWPRDIFVSRARSSRCHLGSYLSTKFMRSLIMKSLRVIFETA